MFVGIAIAVVYETVVRGVAGPDHRQDAARGAGGPAAQRRRSPTRRSRHCGRWCPRRALSLPGVFGIGLYLFVLLMAVPSELRRGIHDQAGGTVVVRSR